MPSYQLSPGLESIERRVLADVERAETELAKVRAALRTRKRYAYVSRAQTPTRQTSHPPTSPTPTRRVHPGLARLSATSDTRPNPVSPSFSRSPLSAGGSGRQGSPLTFGGYPNPLDVAENKYTMIFGAAPSLKSHTAPPTAAGAREYFWMDGYRGKGGGCTLMLNGPGPDVYDTW